MIRSFSSPLVGYAAIRDHSAALLGACFHDSRQRRTRFFASGLVLFITAALLPPTYALTVLAFILWLLLSVSLAWGANEKQRGRIAKKIDNTPPDSLPDLRDLALLTALALLCFLPLLLKKAQDTFGLFRLGEQPGPLAWLWFLLDKTYLRAWPDAIELGFTRFERLHEVGIDYHPGQPGYAGRGLVMFAYTLLYLVLVQGLLRLWQIYRDIKEGVMGVDNDPDMAVRIGRRAVKPLLAAWQKRDVSAATRANILTALGRIGDPAALAVLRSAAIHHDEPEVRTAGLRSLKSRDTDDTVVLLDKVLRNRAETAAVRATAAATLGQLTCPAAAEPLLLKLAEIHSIERRYHEDANVRKEVVRAIGNHLGGRRQRGEEVGDLIDRAVRHLLADKNNTSLLEDVYLRVRNKTAGALAQLGDARGVVPLVERLCDPQFQNAKLVKDTILALGGLLATLQKDAKAVDAQSKDAAVAELVRQLKASPNDTVRKAAAEALGLCKAVAVKDVLIEAFKAALQSGQEELARALKQAAADIDPEEDSRLTDLEKRTGTLWSQRRRQTLLDDERDVSVRLQAAQELGEYRDVRGLKALRMVAGSATVPPELRAACLQSIQLIAPQSS